MKNIWLFIIIISIVLFVIYPLIFITCYRYRLSRKQSQLKEMIALVHQIDDEKEKFQQYVYSHASQAQSNQAKDFINNLVDTYNPMGITKHTNELAAQYDLVFNSHYLDRITKETFADRLELYKDIRRNVFNNNLRLKTTIDNISYIELYLQALKNLKMLVPKRLFPLIKKVFKFLTIVGLIAILK